MENIELIKSRFSCRNFNGNPIDKEINFKLKTFLDNNLRAPFSSKARLHLIPADQKDLSYGNIRKPAAFIVYTTEDADRSLEDCGYLMERAVLYSTGLGLDSCWIGGSFEKKSFFGKINAGDGDILPAIAAVGYKDSGMKMTDKIIRLTINPRKRKAWKDLFFEKDFGYPLNFDEANEYATALEMVRLAPSAGNLQPWRVLKEKNRDIYHFYLQRSNNYQKLLKLMKRDDLQKIDMGIAMCHFEMAASDLNLPGSWKASDPRMPAGKDRYEYIASWTGGN